ncbi:MAG: hypothetical protein D6814_15605 [Calditrichaeota bacterium]|nr:MAG: hypothetical protein D6814_15605 [Calditrichota bacterium]
MKQKQHNGCVWRVVPGREQAYCHLFESNCDACLFNRRNKGLSLRREARARWPEHYYLSREHLWVAPSADGRLLAGIDQFLAEALFHVRCIIQPGINSRIKAGAMTIWVIDIFGTLSLRSPVTGQVVTTNPAIGERPSLIRDYPYGLGWLMEIVPEGNWRENLLESAAAEAFLHQCKGVLKDKILSHSPQQEARPRLTDGGNLSLVDIMQTMPETYLQLLGETLEESKSLMKKY